MDDWVRTIIGGLVGGGIVTAFVNWLKHQDERKHRLRNAYASHIAAVERLRSSTIYFEVHATREVGPGTPMERLGNLMGDIKATETILRLLESSESCLSRLEALSAAVGAFHRVRIEKPASIDPEPFDKTERELREKREDVVREATTANATVGWFGHTMRRDGHQLVAIGGSDPPCPNVSERQRAATKRGMRLSGRARARS